MIAMYIAGFISALVLVGFLVVAWIARAAHTINERSAQRANPTPMGGNATFGRHHRDRAAARTA